MSKIIERPLPTPPSARIRPGEGRRERGSAYIVTLLVLVVLTIIGLSLSLITQTEMQIGGNERIIQRVFYGSDSGINLATARVLTVADYQPRSYTVQESESRRALEQEVEVSAFYPILDTPCNLCEINDAGGYSERAYRRINHAVTSVARRDLSSSSGLGQASKTIAAMVEFQPWRATPNAFLAIDDPDLLDDIKY